MNFRAGPARTGVAHHPEIVLLAAGTNVDFGVKAGSFKKFLPMIVGFLVEFRRIAGAGFIDGGIKAVDRELPFVHDQFPRPFDGFLLEIIAEAPVAEHLEERVVVGVETDVFEVVVFAAGADAFLGVGSAARLVGTFGLAQEDGHKLVHPGVREQEVRRIGQEARRRHNGVLLRLEEVEEVLPDPAARACLRAGRHENQPRD